mmetsp:Transcript_2819/g.6743  ORF Transcript_2819/g.6743 Transcript_2819/m.6743 type:complete len:232 (-) Transcript_2819:651-1346(-)
MKRMTEKAEAGWITLMNSHGTRKGLNPRLLLQEQSAIPLIKLGGVRENVSCEGGTVGYRVPRPEDVAVSKGTKGVESVLAIKPNDYHRVESLRGDVRHWYLGSHGRLNQLRKPDRSVLKSSSMLNHPGVGLGEEGGEGSPMILNKEAGADPAIKMSDNDGPQTRFTWFSRGVIVPTSKKAINAGPTDTISKHQGLQNESLIQATRLIPQEKNGLKKLHWPPPDAFLPRWRR